MEDKLLDKYKEDIKNGQVNAIKGAVRLTFEKLEDLEKEKNIVQHKIKILRQDLYDLKEGRLDRIAERQDIGDLATDVSIFAVRKRIEQCQQKKSFWYEEYEISINGGSVCFINNSVTKMHSGGSYKLKDGSIKYL